MYLAESLNRLAPACPGYLRLDCSLISDSHMEADVGATTKQISADERHPRPMEGYASRGERPPLPSYAVAMAVFNSLFALALLLARRSGRELPERVAAADLATIGVASHKLSRLIAKDKVTSPLRAPFTEYEGEGGPSEFEESARGSGARKAIGEMLICPYCLGLWVVAAFAIGLLFAPRLTRFIAAVFSALALSDFLQIAYKAAEEKGLD